MQTHTQWGGQGEQQRLGLNASTGQLWEPWFTACAIVAAGSYQRGTAVEASVGDRAGTMQVYMGGELQVVVRHGILAWHLILTQLQRPGMTACVGPGH